MRENHHDLRGTCLFNKSLVRTSAKYHSITVKVSLCDELNKFELLFKNNRLHGYEKELAQ